jgi:stress response protein YsnF
VSERIPIIEEVPTVATRVVQGDAVRVSKHAQEHLETVDPALLAEVVDVRRVATRREVDAPVPARLEGDTTIISVHEQVAVVATRWFVVEEIHLRRETREHHAPQEVALVREQVQVERKPAGAPPD